MVPRDGGPATELAPRITAPPWGMAWDDAGNLFYSYERRLWKVRRGSSPEAVTTVGEGEIAHALPQPLPHSQVLLYTVRKRVWSWGDEEVVVEDLATGTRKRVLTDAADARYLASGHLVFMRRDQLWAVRFDASLLETQGQSEAVLDGVAQALAGGHNGNVTGAGQFAAAPSGTLAWISGPSPTFSEAKLVALDRRGFAHPLPTPARSFGSVVRMSPDGRRLVALVRGLAGTSLSIHALGGGGLVPLTLEGDAEWPVWTPDGLFPDWVEQLKTKVPGR